MPAGIISLEFHKASLFLLQANIAIFLKRPVFPAVYFLSKHPESVKNNNRFFQGKFLSLPYHLKREKYA